MGEKDGNTATALAVTGIVALLALTIIAIALLGRPSVASGSSQVGAPAFSGPIGPIKITPTPDGGVLVVRQF